MFPDGNKYWGSRIYKWGEMGWKWGGFQMFVVLSLSHQISLGEMMVQRMWWQWKQASSALFLSHQAHFPASTYHSELVGRGAVLEQDVDDVRVPLLRRLVQRRVPVLQAQGGRESTLRWAQHTHTAGQHPQGELGHSPSFWRWLLQNAAEGSWRFLCFRSGSQRAKECIPSRMNISS